MSKREKIVRKDLTVKKELTGWLVITALVGGHLVTRKYVGYSKRTAAGDFIKEVNDPMFSDGK